VSQVQLVCGGTASSIVYRNTCIIEQQSLIRVIRANIRIGYHATPAGCGSGHLKRGRVQCLINEVFVDSVGEHAYICWII
jgi:hypothetical protein